LALQNLFYSARPGRRLIRSTAFLASCAFLITISPSHPARAWETDGHVLIADVAVRSLPVGPLRGFYTGSLTWFETNSSFPDRWRLRDNAEAPRHFLNTEAFGKNTPTPIPTEYKDVLKTHTYDQLRTDGVLPWAVDRHFKLLVSAFREKRWPDAMVQSLYLSNYVGDACSPFHATANFDGQLSVPPQTGIAARFEKQLVQRTIKAANLRGGAPVIVHDPKAAMLSALQESLQDVPPLLAADKEAIESVKDPDGKQMYDEDYWASFLPKARPIAVARLESGGHLLAGILWEAWNESGRPTPPAGFTASDQLLPYVPPAPLPIDDATIAAAHSEIKTITVPSKRLGKSISVNILLPQQYTPVTTRYPVLYLLHGSSGGYQEWNDKTGLAVYLREMPFIVVMPDANGDSWYVDSPQGGRYSDFFYDELMPYIEKHYATINRREGRAIAGNSMGGYGAWYLALRQPRRFAATASLSGALHFGTGEIGVDENGEFAQILFGDATDPAAKREYISCQLLPLIEKLNQASRYHGPALYFDDGKDDYLNGANRQMEQSLLSLGVPYEYAEFDGSHDWTYWNTHIRDVLQFLQLHLAPPESNRPSHHLLF
jgi:putative tributyrin esterase